MFYCWFFKNIGNLFTSRSLKFTLKIKGFNKQKTKTNYNQAWREFILITWHPQKSPYWHPQKSPYEAHSNLCLQVILFHNDIPRTLRCLFLIWYVPLWNKSDLYSLFCFNFNLNLKCVGLNMGYFIDEMLRISFR